MVGRIAFEYICWVMKRPKYTDIVTTRFHFLGDAISIDSHVWVGDITNQISPNLGVQTKVSHRIELSQQYTTGECSSAIYRPILF